MRYIGILSLLFLLLAPFSVRAQSGPADITLSLVPNNPAPGSTFSVQATSYGADLNQARLSWQYNGKTVLSGVGRTTISLIAPQAGAIGLIRLNASGLGFDPTVATITVQPASIDLIWEAVDGYTPPFYKGKALVAPGAMIRVGAIPAVNAPKGVSFEWSRNDNALQSASGYGKSSVVFKNDILKGGERVSVTASGGLFSGNGMVRIPLYDPTLVIYQNKEGFIDYTNGETGSIAVREAGTILHFEPYFFSIPSSIKSDLSVTLQENDTVIPTQSKLTELTVSRPERGGTTKLQVAIDTIVYSLQHVQKSITVVFN